MISLAYASGFQRFRYYGPSPSLPAKFLVLGLAVMQQVRLPQTIYRKFTAGPKCDCWNLRFERANKEADQELQAALVTNSPHNRNNRQSNGARLKQKSGTQQSDWSRDGG